MKMTKDQQEAKKQINCWLLSDEPEYILSGGAGMGKSWLVNLIISELDILKQKGKILNINTITSAEVTATTNKAAGILNNAITIQKKLKLRMSYDHKTGKKYMVKSGSSLVLYNTLLIIDECSMVGLNLLNQINALTEDCKILFVGDHCQLPPVNEGLSPIFDGDIGISHLREPVRCKVPDIHALNTQLRTTVETGVFKPIQPSDNVKFVGGQLAEETLKGLFHHGMEPNGVKILTYTNKQAVQYDQYIKHHLGRSTGWQVGDLALINNSVKYGNGSNRTNTGSTHVITAIHQPMEYMGVEYRQVGFGHFAVKTPTSWSKYSNILKGLRKQGHWTDVFELEETFADLRDAHASTCHAAQGSSYGSVFINLTELCKCKCADTFARLIYVAVSRARYKVYFTGKLSKQYGG